MALNIPTPAVFCVRRIGTTLLACLNAEGASQIYMCATVIMAGRDAGIFFTGVRKITSHPNLLSIRSDELPIEGLPNFTEAAYVHKRGKYYYLSYAMGFPEKTAYAMSKSIHGPWEYKGILNELAGNSNTNHQSIIDFKGRSFFIYHNGATRIIEDDKHLFGGSFRRSVCIDELFYNKDGTIKRIVMTSEGITKPVK